MILCNYVMLAVVVFNCLTFSMFDYVTERLRQQKRHSEEDYEHATTCRQADRQHTSLAQSAEGHEQATARHDENRKRTCHARSVEGDE